MSPRQKIKTNSKEFSSDDFLFDSVPLPSNSNQHLHSEDIYRQKRDKNNVAVKKSREKSKQKNKETFDKMSVLREENVTLEKRIEDLSEELAELKKELLKKVAGSKSKPSNSLQSEDSKSLGSSGHSSSSLKSQFSEFHGETPLHRTADYEYSGSLHYSPNFLSFGSPHSLDEDRGFF